MELKPETIDAAKRAATRYLEACGYDTIAEGWQSGEYRVDLTMKDGDTTVFCDVHVKAAGDEEFPYKINLTSEELARKENAAVAYLGGSEETFEGPVRFDAIFVMPCSNHRALLKHLVNITANIG